MKKRTRFHVARMTNGVEEPIVNKNTGEIIYKYTEHSATQFFFNINDTSVGKFVLVQTEEVIYPNKTKLDGQTKLDFFK